MDDLLRQMNSILSDYSEEVNEVIVEAQKKVAKSSVSELKRKSPKGSGDYAKSWAFKLEKYGLGQSAIVYNKEHYQLTHLLENGHLSANKNGTYGRVASKVHIKPVEESSAKQFEDEIRKGLS